MFRRLRQAWNRRNDSQSAGVREGFPSVDAPLQATEKGDGLDTLAWPQGAADELILTVNGQRYSLNQLPAELRELVADLQKADELIALRRDTLDTLRTGRNRLRRQLGAGLAGQPPLEEQPTGT